MSDINYDAEKIMERRFKTVPNSAISATDLPLKNADNDFMSASRNFWLKHDGGVHFQSYNEGVLNGTFNSSMPTFKNIYETLLEGFKNIIRIQCEANDKTPEDFALHFEAIDKLYKLLAVQLDEKLDKGIDGESMMAYLQAVIDSFISNSIEIKDK